MKTLLPMIVTEIEAGRSVALATVLEAKGSAPRGAGACMLLRLDGSSSGTVGGGILEHRALQTLTALLAEPSVVHSEFSSCTVACAEGYPSRVDEYSLTQDDVQSLGMVCGGNISMLYQVITPDLRPFFRSMLTKMESGGDLWLVRIISQSKVCRMKYTDGDTNPTELPDLSFFPLCCRKAVYTSSDNIDGLFVEPIALNTHAYLFGGGHVSQRLAPLLAQLGFSPVVYDDRPEFANSECFPTAAVICAPFPQIAGRLSITREDEIVIMTRGHINDLETLTFALRTPAYYIGLIGSRSKIAYTKTMLLQQGFTEADFARVHTPIGLPILAETPMEIAVSVAAEMIMKRAERTGLRH